MKPNTLSRLSSEFVSMVTKTSDSDLMEGLVRASMEKSYYYGFLVIREAMTAIGIYITYTPKAHSEVIEKLKGLCEPKTANAWGRKLRSLRDQRNKATYVLSAKIDKIEAESSILEITELLDELSRDKSMGAEILNYQ